MPMMLFVFYMMGSGISIYTIMFTMNFAISPIKALCNTNQMFEQFEGKEVSLLGPKLLYAAANIISIGLGVYKFSNMGIIPVQPADWAGLYPAQSAYESNQVLI
jgi:ER membrane protein complex subunit 4